MLESEPLFWEAAPRARSRNTGLHDYLFASPKSMGIRMYGAVLNLLCLGYMERDSGLGSSLNVSSFPSYFEQVTLALVLEAALGLRTLIFSNLVGREEDLFQEPFLLWGWCYPPLK